jgi:hypothetical protein
MNVLVSMMCRHAVRQYQKTPIEKDKQKTLRDALILSNEKSGLHSQFCFDEPGAFDCFLSRYGRFENVRNYLALIGKKSDQEKAGYEGEKLVILAQSLGLNSCWVGMSYQKSSVPINIPAGEKLLCVVALGYGQNVGVSHPNNKSLKKLLILEGKKPDYLEQAMQAVLLAPTAMNQQKFRISIKDGKPSIAVHGHGPYVKVDLGIVKYHFEAVSGVTMEG